MTAARDRTRRVLQRSPVLRRTVGRTRRLPLTVEATVVLTLLQCAIRVLPSAQVSRLLGSISAPVGVDRPDVMDLGVVTGQREAQPDQPHPYPQRRDLRRAIVIGRTVRTAAQRLPWHPTCLPRALTTAFLLRRRGIGCRAHLGIVRRTPFLAHAWITVDGVVVQGGEPTGITELATFTGIRSA